MNFWKRFFKRGMWSLVVWIAGVTTICLGHGFIVGIGIAAVLVSFVFHLFMLCEYNGIPYLGGSKMLTDILNSIPPYDGKFSITGDLSSSFIQTWTWRGPESGKKITIEYECKWHYENPNDYFYNIYIDGHKITLNGYAAADVEEFFDKKDSSEASAHSDLIRNKLDALLMETFHAREIRLQKEMEELKGDIAAQSAQNTENPKRVAGRKIKD